MMNRDVMSRQMFANGGAAMPAAPGSQVTPPGLPAIDPGSVDINEAAQGAMQQGIDPAQLEGMLTQYADGMEDLENAEDYETVINGIRGDQLPIEQRYTELSEIVGPEDSQSTPESVLTLLQPVMQMAAVDQGIGGLAAEEMSAPIEGPLAEGIMSTVNMGAPEAPVQVPGGPAPVNFNQGGAVQYMQTGGVSMVDPALQRQQALFDQQRTLFGQLSDPALQEEELAEQQKMTKAQMLFDVAQGALGFAGGAGRPGASPAEQLAAAFTPVIGNIGQRAGELGKFKQAQKAEGRQLDQMALQSAGQLYGAERASELTRDDKPISETFTVSIKDKDGKVTTTNRPLTQGQFKTLVETHGEGNVDVAKVFKPTAAGKAENFAFNGGFVAAIPGTPLYASLIQQGALAAGDLAADTITKRKQYTLTKELTVGDKTYAKGSSPFFSDLEFGQLVSSFGNDVLTEYVAPVSNKDWFNKFGMLPDQFNALDKTTQQYMQGLPVLTDNDYFKKFGMSKNDFLLLDNISRQRLLKIEPEYRFEKIDNGSTIDIVRFDVNDPEAKGVSINSTEIVGKPSLFRVTMPNDQGVMTPTIADLSTTEGKKLVEQVNKLNQANPGSAMMQKISTESNQMSAFLVPNSKPGGGAALRMSFDGGKTYIGSDGLPRLLPPEVVPVGDTVAYDVYKRERVRADARAFLSSSDTAMIPGMSAEGSGFEQITKQDKTLVKDALAEVRAGTGPWSSIFAGVNAVIGGTIDPETFSELFKETEEGRQYTKLIYTLGRSALASSPRFAVTDLEVTGQLFPNPDTFFSNPVSEANKLLSLVEALNAEEIRLQRMRASDSPQDSAVMATAEMKLGEIAKLKQLLGPVSQMSGTAAPVDLSGAQNLLRKKGMNLSGSN